MDAQKGCGLSCAVLSLLSERSPLIGQHSAVQPKGMGLILTNKDVLCRLKIVRENC